MGEIDVLLLGGDGIGPEVVEAAERVLLSVAGRLGRPLRMSWADVGGSAIDRGLPPLPEPTLERALESRAVLLGAVGGPRWDGLPGPERPEAGLLALRKGLGAFANVRPVKLYPGLEGTTPFREAVVRGTDLVIVRELLGGLYFGPRGRRQVAGGAVLAYDTLEYTSAEIDRVATFAFELALQRRRHVTAVDKANILESSRLWRERVNAVSSRFSGVELRFEYVDSCAMKLVRSPAAFDVVLTENTFGDILSDEAAVLAGSLGMLPSASLGGPVGLYEPVHGTAPDIAGKGVANPIGAILSAAMLLELSLGWKAGAQAVEAAVGRVLAAGYRTADLAVADRTPADRVVGTRRMAELITDAL